MPFLGSWCPQCGSNVSVDEDGCCNACGCSAVGQGADEAHATIADLRSRLALMAPRVCEGCGCAPAAAFEFVCTDCSAVADADGDGYDEHHGACVSVGLRALCGRRILEGVE